MKSNIKSVTIAALFLLFAVAYYEFAVERTEPPATVFEPAQNGFNTSNEVKSSDTTAIEQLDADHAPNPDSPESSVQIERAVVSWLEEHGYNTDRLVRKAGTRDDEYTDSLSVLDEYEGTAYSFYPSEQLAQMAENNDSKAALVLGLRMAKEEDFDSATEFLKISAALGSTRAMSMISLIINVSLGKSKSELNRDLVQSKNIESLSWLLTAVQLGDPIAKIAYDTSAEGSGFSETELASLYDAADKNVDFINDWRAQRGFPPIQRDVPEKVAKFFADLSK